MITAQIGTSNALSIDLRTAQETAVLADLLGWIGDPSVEVDVSDT